MPTYTKALGPYSHVSEIKAANRAINHHWFEPTTLRFFGSRIFSPVYYGRYFVSSECDKTIDGPEAERRYTIRCADDTGRISTIGEFQQYPSKRAAEAALRQLVAPVPGTNLDTQPGSAMFATRLAQLSAKEISDPCPL